MRFAVSVVVLFAVLAGPVAPAAAGEPRLDGMYTLTGVNPDGSEYRGLVKIVSRGTSVLVSWMSARLSGETTVIAITAGGVGIVKRGMLAVSFYGQDATGLVVYQIEADGQRLSGEWVSANDDGGTVHSETLTKLPLGATPVPVPSSAPPPESRKETGPGRPSHPSSQAL